jgi:L-aminopeptidase/D-esterase-like protein
MKGLTDIPGIKVGHATDLENITGCTVVLCEGGAVAGLDARGSATGSEEWDLLNPGHLTPAIHAVVLAGGSAFGLEAASGVRRHLEKKGVGFKTGNAVVPLVAGAILYDLGIGNAAVRPTREMGEAAAAAATDGPVAEGCVGAGTGATVGKAAGIANAMKGGIGSATVALGGESSAVKVSALAAVNSFGDVMTPDGRTVLAGARRAPSSKEFLGTADAMKRGLRGGFNRGPVHTTLVVVATNAKLTKVEATKVAQLAQHGMIRAISPIHTMYDGDVIFALSVGNERAEINALGLAAADAVAESILRAVRLATPLGGVPGLRS